MFIEYYQICESVGKADPLNVLFLIFRVTTKTAMSLRITDFYSNSRAVSK